jgi:hypothetical protein
MSSPVATLVAELPINRWRRCQSTNSRPYGFRDRARPAWTAVKKGGMATTASSRRRRSPPLVSCFQIFASPHLKSLSGHSVPVCLSDLWTSEREFARASSAKPQSETIRSPSPSHYPTLVYSIVLFDSSFFLSSPQYLDPIFLLWRRLGFIRHALLSPSTHVSFFSTIHAHSRGSLRLNRVKAGSILDCW